VSVKTPLPSFSQSRGGSVTNGTRIDARQVGLRVVAKPVVVVRAVRHDQVDVAVVVEVGSLRAPAPRRVAHAGRVGDVREMAIAVVPQQAIARRVREPGREDRREEEVEPPVAVEIRRHGAAAVLVGTEAARVGPVDEAAQSVAPEEPRLVEVRDDREVGQPSPSKSAKRVVKGTFRPVDR
jgi:hypothetical protein